MLNLFSNIFISYKVRNEENKTYMVPLFDGKSDYVAHTWRKKGLKKSKFTINIDLKTLYHINLPFFTLHVVIYELPSTTDTLPLYIFPFRATWYWVYGCLDIRSFRRGRSLQYLWFRFSNRQKIFKRVLRIRPLKKPVNQIRIGQNTWIQFQKSALNI